MKRLHSAPRALRAGMLAAAFATVSGAWMSAPTLAAQATARLESIVRLTELGIRDPKDAEVRVIVYASGPARVAVGAGQLAPLTDTLRLTSLEPITADVSESDVHIRLMSSGRLKVGGPVQGGRAIHITATGRHIVLLKGGMGADTITDPE
ncbi:MAG TPA: hypothetical protein VF461_02275 [Gemmatimonadaceae bacterium]